MASKEELIAVIDYYNEKPSLIRWLMARNRLRKLPGSDD